jgi:hypothetical protein
MKNIKEITFQCLVSTHSVYFEGGFNPEFLKRYNGVIVNARGYDGYGHFAIRKHIPFWFKIFMFIRKMLHCKKMLPYKLGHVMWKNDREKIFSLHFNDYDNSISIVAAMSNPSYRKLTFDKETYEDLKSCIPPFLEHVGYKFTTKSEDDIITLTFEYPENEKGEN